MTRPGRAVALVLMAVLALTGCARTDTTPTPSRAAANEADVTFLTQMIPHHEQAVVMSKMVSLHGASTELEALAKRIEAAQGPEIDTMRGWLKAWGKDEPSGDSMGGMGDGTGNGTGDGGMGMMSEDDLTGLDNAAGIGFDQMWLTQMIKHHAGAIEMARTEASEGKSAKVKALAHKIAADQTAEIAEMKKMLAT